MTILEKRKVALDLRTSKVDETAYVKEGVLYRSGLINQVWWNGGIPETWTAYTEEDAIDNFNDMKERWNL